MPTLVILDDSPKTPDLPGKDDRDVVVLEALLREHELRVLTELDITPADIQQVASESAAIMEQIGDALPPALRRGRAPDSPSFWDCYGELFRSWSVAPLLANALVARRAVEACGADDVIVIEDPARGGWWGFRQQVLDATRAGLLGTGIEPRARPGGFLRGLRMGIAGGGGAWALGLAGAAGGRHALKLRRWRAQLDSPAPADALFLAIGGTSVPIIDRLAPRLAERHGLSSAAVMFDPRDMGMQTGARSAVPYQYIDTFHAGPRGFPSLIAHQTEVLLGWPRWLAHACRHAPKPELGRLWPPLRNRLTIALARDSQQLLADMTAAARMLDVYRPKVIIAQHLYWRRIAPLVLAAQGRGIPVIYLQHGVYLARDECISPLPYDEFMVFGEAPAETLRPRAPGATITPVGHCLYDDLAARRAGAPDEIRALRGDASGVVLIATQPDETAVSNVDDPEWWVRGVAQACAELGVRAIIKLHPQDTEVGVYEQLEESRPDTVTLLRHGVHTLPDLLAGADCLITRDSTVVLEANLLAVPAITINLTGMQDRFPFAAEGGARGVYEFADILPAIREALRAEAPEQIFARRRFLARHTGPADGNAAGRVTDTIAWHASGQS